MTGVKRRFSDSDIIGLHKELDEVSCPICMDHPHNAVLLRCSSFDKGCRSFICDTSYRHSNCLDRFKKVGINCRTSPTSSSSHHGIPSDRSDANYVVISNINEADIDRNEINTELTVGLSHGARPVNIQDLNRPLESQDESENLVERVEVEELNGDGSSTDSKLILKCPLCRGTVLGWEVVEEARNYLNTKKRGCSRDLCTFTGNYNELRRHARRVHPTTRPSDVDPSRERAWRHLEHQREYGDIVSAIRSAMPGAVVVGDYVIANGDGRFPVDREGGMGGDGSAPWWSTLLFQMIGSIENVGEPRGRSRAWTRHRRGAGGSSSDRRYLWGENLLGLRGDDDEENENLHQASILHDVDEEASPLPRRRRRGLSRSRSNGE